LSAVLGFGLSSKTKSPAHVFAFKTCPTYSPLVGLAEVCPRFTGPRLSSILNKKSKIMIN